MLPEHAQGVGRIKKLQIAGASESQSYRGQRVGSDFHRSMVGFGMKTLSIPTTDNHGDNIFPSCLLIPADLRSFLSLLLATFQVDSLLHVVTVA